MLEEWESPQNFFLDKAEERKNDVRTDITPMVGIHLMKFCGKYELTRISEQGEAYAKWLNSPYKGILNGN